nr:F0F1 ATP synthase subunit delta [Pacificibacter marinus]
MYINPCIEEGRPNDIGRVDVSEPASISRGIAARYATALFDLAKESKELKALEGDVASLASALADSADLNAVIASPVVSREEHGAVVSAISKKAKFSPIMANTLALLAQNRRLFVLPQLVETLNAMLAEERGELTADVTSAKALTKTQSDKLAKTLSAQFGKDVTINATVDDSIIGGLIVKVGSKMIDTSIASKLASLQNVMKEVG